MLQVHCSIGIANVEDSTIISASADKEIKMWLGYKSLI